MKFAEDFMDTQLSKMTLEINRFNIIINFDMFLSHDFIIKKKFLIII